MTVDEARALVNRVVLGLDDRTIVGLARSTIAAVERVEATGHQEQALDAADLIVEALNKGTWSDLDRALQTYKAVRPQVRLR